MSSRQVPMLQKRVLPKLMACMTKNSMENMRNKLLFSVDALDAKGIRRRKLPLYQCLILELREAGYIEASSYLQDLLYDNSQLVAEDDIGIVVDLRQQKDYLENIAKQLQIAEREHERGNVRNECVTLLCLAQRYGDLGKGILWLAEKFFHAAIAVSSRYLLDGGRLKAVCKYYYAKFLLDKFPDNANDEAFKILTEVRDCAIGRPWPLYKSEKEGEEEVINMLFKATATQLHRVLLNHSKKIRKTDAPKAERLARLAERRGMDSNDIKQIAEAVVEVGICQLMMNNLNNAKKTFERAFSLNTEINSVEGLCVTRMHLAAVYQRMGDHETAARLLTEMGALAMDCNLQLQLGRALHLLGELHLRRERPDLGTYHLTEAFFCFLGVSPTVIMEKRPELSTIKGPMISDVATGLSWEEIYATEVAQVYHEEAEQSRLMMAISAGQELMSSYFNLLKEARDCSVATIKVIEWKLSRTGWWLNVPHHDLQPCPCELHRRTPLDVLKYQLELKEHAEKNMTEIHLPEEGHASMMDIQGLRSDLTQPVKSKEETLKEDKSVTENESAPEIKSAIEVKPEQDKEEK